VAGGSDGCGTSQWNASCQALARPLIERSNPEVRFIVSRDRAHLADHELASRLSYLVHEERWQGHSRSIQSSSREQISGAGPSRAMASVEGILRMWAAQRPPCII
jgi:hypothetical protein